MSLALLVPTLLAASLSPELNAGPLTPGPSFGQSGPAVAFDGTNYLVAWHDHRNGNEGHVVGRLVSRAGVPQGADFNLLDASGNKEMGSVVFDGTAFAVAMNYAGFPALVRVSPAGNVLDPSGILVSTGAVGSVVRLAFDGANYVLVWADYRGAYKQIYAARITRRGQVLDPGGQLISTNLSNDARDPDLVFDGTDFIVAWSEGDSLVSTRVARDLTAAGPGPVSFFTAGISLQSGPRLAGIAGGAVATFLERSADGENEARLVRVQVAAAPVVVSTRHAYDAPAVESDGTRYLAYWSDDSACRLYAQRISPALVVQDGDGTQLMGGTTGHQSNAALALDGAGGALLTFVESNFNSGISFTPLTPATLGVSGAGAPLTESAPDQAEPSLAISGGHALLSWVETTSDRRNISLVSATPGSASPVPVVQVTAGLGDRREASVASDGASRVLAAWRDENGELKGQLFDQGGAVVSPAQTLCSGLDTWTGHARAGWDGTQFVVAFVQGTPTTFGVRLVRLAADGAPTARCGRQVASIDPVVDAFLGLQLAAGNGAVLVMWSLKDETTYTHRIEFAREQGGAVVDASPVVLDKGAGAEGARAAWDGTGFIAVWHVRRRWSNDIVAQRVPASGPLTDTVHPLITSDADEVFPDIAWDGQRGLVTWEDRRRGRPDVYATFIDGQLNPAAAEGFPISNTTQEDTEGRVVAVGPGRFVVAYTRFEPTGGVVARRVGLRWVSDLAQAATCAANDECQSGFCVDGVCCDSRCGDGAGDCEACSAARGAPTDGVCAVLAAATECRASGSECDVAERCDGTSRACPVDRQRPDGLACSAGAGVCGAGACLTGTPPHFTSAVSVQLTCGQTYSYSKAGRPQVAGDGPFTFSARTADGSPLPEGFSIDAATGEIAWQTSKAHTGPVTVELRVESAAGVDTQLVELVVECQQRNVVVSCSQVGLLGLPLLALLLLRRRR